MDEVQKALRDRYPAVHPLLFHRSMERSKSNGELFDILETIPNSLPLVWDEQERVWKTTDLLQSERFRQVNERKQNDKK